MIKKDFPTLTEEQIADNIDLIDEYYSQNLDYETIAGLADKTESDKTKLKAKYGISKKSSDSGRLWCILRKIQNPAHMIVPIITYGRYRTGEFSYIRSLISIHYATADSKKYSKEEYGNFAEFDTKRDAYRHIMYSALLAKYYWTVSKKTKRLKFAELVGYANEDCGGNLADGMYMDFHNNRIGRDLFDKNTSYKKRKVLWFRVTYGLNLPSLTTIKNLTKNLVNSGRFIDKDRYSNLNQRVSLIKNTNKNQVVYLLR